MLEARQIKHLLALSGRQRGSRSGRRGSAAPRVGWPRRRFRTRLRTLTVDLRMDAAAGPTRPMLLNARVTHESIRQWGLKFGGDFARRLRRRRPKPGDTWHLDEVLISSAKSGGLGQRGEA